MELAVKRVGPDTIEGLAFPYTTDTDGERFTPDTDLCLDWFGKSGRPVIYDHTLDEPAAVVVGRQVEYEERADGRWAQAQLEKAGRYRKAIDSLIEQGALGFSSGAYAIAARRDRKSKTITRWPWVELSLTPVPAHPETMVHYVKSSDIIRRAEEAGEELPIAAMKAIASWADSLSPEPTGALPDGAPIADLIDRLSVDGPAWVKARLDWHTKSGRVLSAAIRERLLSHPATLRQLADDLDDLLATADAGKSTALVGADWAADLAAQRLAFDRVEARLMGVPLD